MNRHMRIRMLYFVLIIAVISVLLILGWKFGVKDETGAVKTITDSIAETRTSEQETVVELE